MFVLNLIEGWLSWKEGTDSSWADVLSWIKMPSRFNCDLCEHFATFRRSITNILCQLQQTDMLSTIPYQQKYYLISVVMIKVNLNTQI